jgi:aminoglycoside phosphotransferase (APT) family kinase protein
VTTQTQDTELRPTHRDMKPEHVLLDGGELAFIDLDSCAAADPVLDVALMLARFAALAGADADRQRLQDVAALFSAEYFSRVPAEWRSRLPHHYAASLLEVAAGIFHRQENDWRRRVTALVREAAAISTGSPLSSLWPSGRYRWP